MSTKVLITNLGQLKTKYGSGVSQIKSAINRLIKADAARGIKTKLIEIDDPTQMQGLSAAGVTSASNYRQNKAAVDAVNKALVPDYIAILGAPDVIPHQNIINPLHGDSDPDEIAWGDIPYACEAPYSQDPKDFIGPTRVVGRVPDIQHGTDPAYLVKVLTRTADWKSHSVDQYQSYLGISAKVWHNSTALNLLNVFGSNQDLQDAPPRGPNWPPPLLTRLSHFINCHGAPSDPHFYGQQGNSYPVSHDATLIDGRLKVGTVVAAECCYGAELYDPTAVVGQQIGICSTYLANGAYGFLGSTTIAYGPADSNASADLICQYFFNSLLTGASLGRATLVARQQFAKSTPELGPEDLKTIAQFNLLGDPSIQPVETPALHESLDLIKRVRVERKKMQPEAYERENRRRQLLLQGSQIYQTQATASQIHSAKMSPNIAKAMRQIAEESGLGSPEYMSFAIERPAISGMKRRFAVLAEKMSTPSAFHVAAERFPTKETGIFQISLLVVKEQDGQIISVRKLVSR